MDDIYKYGNDVMISNGDIGINGDIYIQNRSSLCIHSTKNYEHYNCNI